MTENNNNQEQPKKKLTLSIGSSAAKAKGDDNSQMIQQRLGRGKSSTVVEVVKVKSRKADLRKAPGEGSGTGITVQDQMRKLELIKRAAAEEAVAREKKAIAEEARILENPPEADEIEEILGETETVNNDIPPLEVTEEIIGINLQSAREKEETKHHKKEETPAVSEEEDEDDELTKKSKAKVGFVDKAKKPVKSKFEDDKKFKSTNLKLLVGGEPESERMPSLAALKRKRDKERKQRMGVPREPEKIIREVVIPEKITVGDLSVRMAVRSTDVIRELMKLGVMAKADQDIDADTAEIIVEAFGHKFRRIAEADIEKTLEETDSAESLTPRPPVVTIMGHVDHGKTSLLDAIRAEDVAAGEAGGITQHIGAYQITTAKGELITFIDTPGHEAFTAMRSRGAKATDIVVLVVAADDGIMAQTIEAINHAKAAGVPIIVAINKIDKPDADIERVKTELLAHELVPEDFGGDIMCVPVSAKARTNLDKLEEAILLQAEMLELKANYHRKAAGVVIEAKLDKGKGILTTLLVQKGTLRNGDIVVAGTAFGKVRAISDDKGRNLESALPSTPVEIMGLSDAPNAGDPFAVAYTEKQARDIIDYRLRRNKNTLNESNVATLEELFTKAGADAIKELPVIIKGDVHGSVEAIIGSLAKLTHNEVKVRVLHSGVGAINESDVGLSAATKAIILGFNVRATAQTKALAEKEGVDIRYYNIIYNLVDDMKVALSGMLKPILREQYLGTAEIRQIFIMSKYGKVAGAYVTDGIIKRGSGVRLLRDNIVIHEGKLKTLRRFKDEVKEVNKGFECGLAFENYEDIKEGDVVEFFEIIEEKQSL